MIVVRNDTERGAEQGWRRKIRKDRSRSKKDERQEKRGCGDLCSNDSG
jgi:hypothetical protein